MEDQTRQLICVVDDERTNALMLSMMLEPDFNVCVAHTGMDAIDMVRARKPDLILLDIILPDLNGYEVCAVKGRSCDKRYPCHFCDRP